MGHVRPIGDKIQWLIIKERATLNTNFQSPKVVLCSLIEHSSKSTTLIIMMPIRQSSMGTRRCIA
jgi:hypothetical protein